MAVAVANQADRRSDCLTIQRTDGMDQPRAPPSVVSRPQRVQPTTIAINDEPQPILDSW